MREEERSLDLDPWSHSPEAVVVMGTRDPDLTHVAGYLQVPLPCVQCAGPLVFGGRINHEIFRDKLAINLHLTRKDDLKNG